MRDKPQLNRIGKHIESLFPGTVFLVMIADPSKPARAHYVSNGSREEVINVMKEFLIKAGQKEDWMKHLP